MSFPSKSERHKRVAITIPFYLGLATAQSPVNTYKVPPALRKTLPITASKSSASLCVRRKGDIRTPLLLLRLQVLLRISRNGVLGMNIWSEGPRVKHRVLRRLGSVGGREAE